MAGVATAGGELLADSAYLFVYHATADRFDAIGVGASLAHTEITSTNTDLATGTRYYDRAGTNTHTLPALSTTRDGDRIEVYVTDANHTVTINEHASDANAQIATLNARGDFVRFVVVNGAWHVEDERVTVKAVVALTADETIGSSNQSKFLDQDVSVLTNIGGAFDDVTTIRFNAPFACRLQLNATIYCSSEKFNLAMRVNGADAYEVSGQSNITTGVWTWTTELELASGDYVEWRAYNADSSNQQIMGDANEDETRVEYIVRERIR